MNQVLAHDKGSFEFVPLLHRALRVVVVLNWLVILAAVLLRGVPKALALNAFAAVSLLLIGAMYWLATLNLPSRVRRRLARPRPAMQVQEAAWPR